jgi:DNA-binding beta-propeller fold protein YncE
MHRNLSIVLSILAVSFSPLARAEVVVLDPNTLQIKTRIPGAGLGVALNARRTRGICVDIGGVTFFGIDPTDPVTYNQEIETIIIDDVEQTPNFEAAAFRDAPQPEGEVVYATSECGGIGDVYRFSVYPPALLDVIANVGNGDEKVAVGNVQGTHQLLFNTVEYGNYDQRLVAVDIYPGSPTENQVVKRWGFDGLNPEGLAVIDKTTVVGGASGYLVYFTDENNNAVDVADVQINPDTDEVTFELVATLPGGDVPEGGAAAPDGSQIATTASGVNPGGRGSLTIINTATNAVERAIELSGVPEGVAFSPDGREIYVANYDGLLVYNQDTEEMLAVDTGRGTYDVKATDRDVYVSRNSFAAPNQPIQCGRR